MRKVKFDFLIRVDRCGKNVPFSYLFVFKYCITLIMEITEIR